MTEAPIRVEKLPLEEFVRLYDQEGPFEIIDGERIFMSPIVQSHNNASSNLVWALMSWLNPRNLGKLYIEAPFVLVYNQNWVTGSRVPDMMFVSAVRLEGYKDNNPDWESKPLVLVPDLVVEIVSQTDRYSDVDAKVDRYLEDGVKLVWVLDPQRRKVSAHQLNSNRPLMLSGEDVLTGDDVIPGFEITVSKIFE